VDTALNLVSVYTNHFTVYAIGSKMSAPERLKSYWTHNPLVRSRQSTFIYDLPSKAKVSLHVYDLAGDLVRIIIPEKTEKATGSHQARWDGTNGHNRFAGTGLYIYLFKAEIKGKLDIVKKPIGIINR
jgi:flagellar hook assembly protein FlgD